MREEKIDSKNYGTAKAWSNIKMEDTRAVQSTIEHATLLEYIDYLENMIDKLVCAGKAMEMCSKRWVELTNEWKGIDK